MRLDNPDDNTQVGASSSSTPPLHAEVRATLDKILNEFERTIIKQGSILGSQQGEIEDAICQAVADALLSELPKAIDSVEVDVEATRRHMESKGATENQILNMEIEADDRHDVLKDALDAVTRVISELGGGKDA